MIYIKNLIKTVAFALNIFSLQFSQLFKTRIIVIILFYSGVLAFNTFYIQLLDQEIDFILSYSISQQSLLNIMTSNKNKTLFNRKYNLNETNLNLTSLVLKFISDITLQTNYIFVIVNVKLVNGEIFSLGERYPLDITKPGNYIDYLKNYYSMQDNRYKVVPAVSVYFNYSVINEELFSHRKYLLEAQETSKKSLGEIQLTDVKPLGLPLDTHYLSWGSETSTLKLNLLKITDLIMDKGTELSRYVVIKYLTKTSRTIDLFSSVTNIKMQTALDKIINTVKGDFIREIGERLYYIKENSVYFIFERLFSTSEVISKMKKDKHFSFNIITLDIETYKTPVKLGESELNLYCISLYDGKKAKSFYITDYNSTSHLISEMFKLLLTRKYSQKTVFIHNSSEFDLIFLLKSIVNLEGVVVEPIIKDGKYINLKIKYGPKNTYYLNFRDSLLLLPVSLRKLCSQFKVKTPKSIFPYDFVNKDNLNYVGKIPSLTYFKNISLQDYQLYAQNFVNNNWSLKDETIKYCEIDCIALYQVIETFSKLIFDLFKVNVSSVSTLPSLAFKIFRTNFLDTYVKIPVLSGKIYNDVSQAYYGGHVDMYVPTNPEGELVYQYDVNSLYPFVMFNYRYPTNLLAYFKGDISIMDEYSKLFKSSLAILKVRVVAPDNIEHPLLPVKMNGTTVYGTGTWTAWYNSDELYNAKNFGYNFDILEGYLFEGTDLFSKFVDKLSQIKEKAPSNSPMYIIAKLLMNSLYGKFGMKPKLLSHSIINRDDKSNIIEKIGDENIVNQIELDNKIILSYWIDFYHIPKINVAIASSVTSNARIYMSKFKNNPEFVLYYTDTDSYFFNKPLPAQFVETKKLGLFKLERILSKFVSLGPKVYGGITTEGIEFTKAKGLKTKVSVTQLESLLIKDNILKFDQEKWFNRLSDSTISIKDLSYRLKTTDTKRNLVYKNGVLVSTTNKNIIE